MNGKKKKKKKHVQKQEGIRSQIEAQFELE